MSSQPTSIPVPSTIPIQIDLRPTMGPILIGVVLGAVFLGITWLQTVFYYRTYTKDPMFLKVLVGTLWLLDTLSTILWTNAIYIWVIIDFNNPIAVETTWAWSAANEPIVTALITLTVHLFLVYRIQVLNYKWRPLSFVIGFLSLLPFGAGIAAAVISDTLPEYSSTSVTELRWCAIIGDVSTCVIDITIAASISFLLYRNRGGFPQTDRIINAITLYVVTSGLITSTLTTTNLILELVFPLARWQEIIYISISKAYTNTLLATLNSRTSREPTSISGGSGTLTEFRVAPGMGTRVGFGLRDDELLEMPKRSREIKPSSITRC